MSYEECSNCNHSTEFTTEDGEDFPIDCSICIKEKTNCEDHGMCTIDPDVCVCCGSCTC
jgi:hypothetical protein